VRFILRDTVNGDQQQEGSLTPENEGIQVLDKQLSLLNVE
jgi:hypothetical protein